MHPITGYCGWDACTNPKASCASHTDNELPVAPRKGIPGPLGERRSREEIRMMLLPARAFVLICMPSSKN